MSGDLSEAESVPAAFAEGSLIEIEILKRYLKFCGTSVRVFGDCRIVPPGRVSIGHSTQIDEGVRIFAGNGITIGKHVHIAIAALIFGGGECSVGDYASIGAGTRIITGSDLPIDCCLTNPTVPLERRSVRRSRTIIQSFSIIYTNAIVFPGVTIGHGAVVSAGSVVRRDLEPWRIYAGDPLVAVGERQPPDEFTN